MAGGKFLLTDSKVKALLRSGLRHRHRDGDGLWLNISGPNSGSWISRYTVSSRGKKKGTADEMGLGSYPAISLGQARKYHSENKEHAALGINPRKVVESHSYAFRDIFFEFFAKKRQVLNNSKNIKQWESTMETYVLPVIGDLVVGEITHREIVEVMEPIWIRIPDTASKVLQRISNVFDYAIANDYRMLDNPATKQRINHILTPVNLLANRENHPHIPPERFPVLYQHLYGKWLDRDSPSNSVLGALIFMSLTTARSQTIRHARWCDIDIERGFWTPPPSTMKSGVEFRYPLSAVSINFLRLAKQETKLLFPAPFGGESLSDSALSKYMREVVPENLVMSDAFRPDGLKKRSVPHGIRSTFSTWANENEFDDPIVEMCLAHTDKNKVRAAYQRSDLPERRRQVFQAWAEFISQADK